mgnify:FL=1
MYSNISLKIKSLAKVLCTIGIIISCLAGFLLIVMGILAPRNSPCLIIGLPVAGVGSLFSWLSNFLLYGFGQLIENTNVIRRYCELQHSVSTDASENTDSGAIG